jgi:hypothetical protein
MLKWIVTASVLAASAILAASVAADEPVPTAAPSAQSPSEQTSVPVKTGKERLSSKAADEQRVDNCKVPPERRGTTVRPDTCESKEPPVPTN